MFAQGYDQATAAVEAWTKPTRAAFEFWVSFWPVAPLFGVEWRFSEAMGQAAATRAPAKPEKPAKRKAVKLTAVAGRADEAAGTAVAEAEKALAEASAKVVADAAAVVEAAFEAVGEVTAATAELSEPAATFAPAEVAEPVEPVASVEDAVEAAAAADDGAPTKPKGLLKKAPADADDLKMLRGVGPGLEKQLNALGIYRFAQIAAFSETDLAWVDDNLTAFKGRCFRDDWIGQAKALMG